MIYPCIGIEVMLLGGYVLAEGEKLLLSYVLLSCVVLLVLLLLLVGVVVLLLGGEECVCLYEGV